MMQSNPPKGTRAGGRRLWRAVVADFDLAPWELDLLRQSVAVVDNCESLQAIAGKEGLLLEDRVHPATIELRLQRVLLVKLLADLRIPDDDEPRPPRRSGSRGAYGKREAS